jgi:hypothetical protein
VGCVCVVVLRLFTTFMSLYFLLLTPLIHCFNSLLRPFLRTDPSNHTIPYFFISLPSPFSLSSSPPSPPLSLLLCPYPSLSSLTRLHPSFPYPYPPSPDDVHRLSLAYVASCVEMSVTYKVLKPHMDFIIFSVIFPTLCLSPEDIR